jgi:hypothetical protein
MCGFFFFIVVNFFYRKVFGADINTGQAETIVEVLREKLHDQFIVILFFLDFVREVLILLFYLVILLLLLFFFLGLGF